MLYQGPRPIHWACRKGHASVVQVLLQSGVAVNAADFKGDRFIFWLRTAIIGIDNQIGGTDKVRVEFDVDLEFDKNELDTYLIKNVKVFLYC